MNDPQDFPTPPFETAEPLALDAVAPPPPAKRPNPVFFGRFGLRAGYGIAIFIVLFLLISTFAGFFGVAAGGHIKELMAARQQAQLHPNAPRSRLDLPFTSAMVIVQDGLSFLGLLLVCWFFAKGERRPLASFGIGRSRLADFLPGAFWGLASLSALVLILWLTHHLSFDQRLLGGPTLVLYGLKWLLAFLCVGFAEEYTMRGYMQFTLTRGVFGLAERLTPARARFSAFWIAATIMSLLFGALHLGNKGENAFGIAMVVLVGLVFSYVLWRTGSLWWAIGFHMAWDWAQSFLYGVPDSGNISVGRLFQTHAAGNPLLSGGVDGPEGSIFCVPVMLAVALVVYLTTTPGPQPALEPGIPANDSVPGTSAPGTVEA